MRIVQHRMKDEVVYVGPPFPEPPAPGSGSWVAVQNAMNWLMINEEYWASYLSEFNRIITREVPTAAVSYATGALQMLINPDYISWDKLETMRMKAGVLVHEMLHPAMGHLTEDPVLGDLGNICFDLSVNSNMAPGMRADFHLHPRYFVVNGKPLEGGRGWKFYWDKLVDTNILEVAKGAGLIDAAGASDGENIFVRGKSKAWGDEPGSVIEHASKEALRAAAAKVGNTNIPSVVKKMLELKFTPPTPPWDKFLASSCRSALNKGGRRTLAKRGRRTRRPPGQERVGGSKVLYAIDTSGSMTDEDCLMGVAVMKQLVVKDNVTVLCQQFDVTLQGELVEVDKFERLPTTFYGRGGTRFDAVISLANKLKVDLLVITTDGHAPDPRPPNCPTIWVITPGGNSNKPFGKKVLIPEKVKSDESEW